MRAADHIVGCLQAHGVTRAYCVPGESFLALLDGVHDSGIEVVVCRHESGAGFMACAEAKLTGRPAVCMVSRGPGATNASIAMHMAEQDALPVIMIVGQVSRDERTRGAFQEIDYTQFFVGIAKAVFEVTQGKRLIDIMPRAFRLAQEGVPGPVIISLPEDVLDDEVSERAATVFPIAQPAHRSQDNQRILDLIDRSDRPLVMAGARLRGTTGADALRRFAEALRIPVAATWKNQDVFDNGSDLYAGHTGFGTPQILKDLLSESDLIIAAGTRLGDLATLNYTLPASPEPSQTLVHIYPAGQPLGRNTRADVQVLADPVALLSELSQNARVVSSAREAWVSRIRDCVKGLAKFEDFAPDDGVNFGAVVTALYRHAPKNAVLTTDSGNASTWVHRHWVMSPKNTLLGAIAGSMGFGVPSATAASLIDPDRMAICFVGDGGVLMTGQELATAVAYGARPKVVISDNGTYGTIRGYQERHYPGRVSGTTLVNPDFTAWAKSFGVAAHTISRGDDVDAVVQAFLAEPGAAVLHVKSSKIALSAYGKMPR